jgi:hypothetical protein
MVDEKVYYIKLQSYHSYIPFEQLITRFINSKLYDQHYASLPCLTASGKYMTVANNNRQVHKQISSIEMNNVLLRHIKASKYDAKKVISKINPREIDEIISKYILYHLQMFFKENRPNMNVSTPQTNNKTRKLRDGESRRIKPRVFDINKDSALSAFKKEFIANKRVKTRKMKQ